MKDFMNAFNYDIIISKTFPGSIMFFWILISFQHKSELLLNIVFVSAGKTGWGLLAVCVVMFYLSTLIGLIIDVIHHAIENTVKLIANFDLPRKEQIFKTYFLHPYMVEPGKLESYRDFIISEWHFYEFCINSALALIICYLFSWLKKGPFQFHDEIKIDIELSSIQWIVIILIVILLYESINSRIFIYNSEKKLNEQWNDEDNES